MRPFPTTIISVPVLLNSSAADANVIIHKTNRLINTNFIQVIIQYYIVPDVYICIVTIEYIFDQNIYLEHKTYILCNVYVITS